MLAQKGLCVLNNPLLKPFFEEKEGGCNEMQWPPSSAGITFMSFALLCSQMLACGRAHGVCTPEDLFDPD